MVTPCDIIGRYLLMTCVTTKYEASRHCRIRNLIHSTIIGDIYIRDTLDQLELVNLTITRLSTMMKSLFTLSFPQIAQTAVTTGTRMFVNSLARERYPINYIHGNIILIEFISVSIILHTPSTMYIHGIIITSLFLFQPSSLS